MTFDTTNWRTEKMLTVEQAAAKAAEFRAAGKKLVTVNGSFDILHAGHLDQLEEAKQQGDVLFIGINSDASVKDGKGPTRPFITEQARAAMLAALACTDYVIIIDAPYNKVQDILIDTVQPSVHVNGPDYGKPETWIEWPVMQKYGTAGYACKVRNQLSTTALVQKIRDEKI
jgi:D-glycero-beta-D-manno-heptose 1-phosphate adenylyltransferase